MSSVIEQADIEIDNLRAAFGWSRENSDIELALALASSLQPLWQARGRIREGLAWFDAALADLDAQHPEVAAAVRARALADKAVLDAMGRRRRQHGSGPASPGDRARCRRPGPAGPGADRLRLHRRHSSNAELARAYFAEAIGLARALGDRWRLSQILALQARGAHVAGDPIAMRAAAEEGRDLADAIGDRFNSRQCRFYLGMAQLWRGDLAGAVAQFGEVAAEAEAAHDEICRVRSLAVQGVALACQGETAAARAAAEAAVEAAAELGEVRGHRATRRWRSRPWPPAMVRRRTRATRGGLASTECPARGGGGIAARLECRGRAGGRGSAAARRWADEAVSTTTGWYSSSALTTRARVAIAQGEPEQAERDAHDALARAAELKAYLLIPDILECLATLAGEGGSHREAARLFGAAARHPATHRARSGSRSDDAGYEASVAALRDALGEKDFDSAWAEGAALSTEEAIAYAQRGRGERKRPTSGWASLTPTERDVVRLVSEGLANNDIATRLFVSPRTVQTHLTHVYTKLGLTSRVQLVQEAARHT